MVYDPGSVTFPAPTKISPVHVSFPSRAERRGLVSAVPSCRMKREQRYGAGETGANLSLSFGLPVAELSPFAMLKPGDVILSGMPAGASIVEPGDKVGVEPAGVSTVPNRRLLGAALAGNIGVSR
jgi:Fumarylacetoacetate (FAA) hydrolase family